MLIAPRYLHAQGALHEGRALRVEAGRIVEVTPAQGTADLAPFLVMAGCHDLQVNGGGGMMVNSDPTPEGLRAILAAHRARGTTALLPTVITDTPEVIDAVADAAIAVAGEPGQLGLHIEGPHIAPERRGTHDAAHVRPLDARTLATVERLRAAGRHVMVTLAPERADPALLARLVALGAVVSAGHSTASAEEARAGFAAGVACVTHLFNAMPPMTSRAPGLLGAAILSDCHCGMIADGIHVSWDMIRLALAARPRHDRTFLVSDAMATVGGPEHFDLYGQTIRLDGGTLVNAEGALAGAHLDMVTALANLHRFAGVPLARAVAMATDVPRAVLGLAPLDPAPGAALSDFIALREDLTYMPWGTP